MPLDELEPPRFVGTAEIKKPSPNRWLELAVVLAAVVGHFPALGAWWTLDDWGLLGQASGLIPTDAPLGFPARWLSQHLYWDLLYPLFGLSAAPYAWSRLILHALSAWLVTRIALRAGLEAWPRLIAGLMLAVTPLAFTPLYWAAGVQELLAAVLALLAVERWLARGRANIAWAVVCAALSMLAKESGMGLPLLFLAFLWMRIGVDLEDKAYGWAMTLLLLVVTVVEGTLVMSHFATGPGDPYAMGGMDVILTNLGVFGWWLLSPGPLLASNIHWPMAAAGLMLFVGWTAWGINQQRQGRPLPLLTLLAAVLVVAPALALRGQLHPYLAYLAVAPMGLAVGALVPGRLSLRSPVLAGVAVVAAAWCWWSMDLRLGQRDGQGLPTDPVVRATSISWRVCRGLPDLPLERGDNSTLAVTFLQVPLSLEAAEMAERLGDRFVPGTHLYHSLGGTLGPRLILDRHHGRPVTVDWVNALFSNPGQALVLSATGFEFKHWGSTANAAYLAALTDVGMGRFERARKHLIRAGGLQKAPGGRGAQTASFFYDPSQMIIPMGQVLARKEEFIDWTLDLLEQDHSPQEVGGLQDTFIQLLAAGTGMSRDELTAGSTLIDVGKKRAPATKPSGE